MSKGSSRNKLIAPRPSRRPLGSELTHLDEQGQARMVDVGTKPDTQRWAVASAVVHTRPDVIEAIRAGSAAKGDVLAVARVAGIMAAKRTAELIPLCHPLRLDTVKVDLTLAAASVCLRAEARCTGPTGVEMEALTAASVAALTVYDMCKALDRRMRITDLCLEEKSGGRSGSFRREACQDPEHPGPEVGRRRPPEEGRSRTPRRRAKPASSAARKERR